jgi:hypothetical protein
MSCAYAWLEKSVLMASSKITFKQLLVENSGTLLMTPGSDACAGALAAVGW